jgi:hypothetical protein
MARASSLRVADAPDEERHEHIHEEYERKGDGLTPAERGRFVAAAIECIGRAHGATGDSDKFGS